MNGTPRFTQEEIQALPRWARLAFAARCVRRARGLLQGPAERLEAIDRALTLVEQASRVGHADDRLAEAAAAAYTYTLNAVEFAEPPPGAAASASAEDTLVVACSVAHAAAFAAEATTIAAAKMAAYLAAQSVDFAIQAHLVADPALVPEVVAAMRADLELLQEAVASEGWGNLMPVGPEFFEPLR
jgi:hypothetical protein